MKNLNDFEPRVAKRDSDATGGFFFIAMLAGAGLIFIVPTLVIEQSTPATYATCLFGGLGVVGLFLFLHLKALGRLLVATQEDYWRYLDTMALSKLKLATISPELENNTRESVKKYLSVHHPGWSLKPSLEY